MIAGPDCLVKNRHQQKCSNPTTAPAKHRHSRDADDGPLERELFHHHARHFPRNNKRRDIHVRRRYAVPQAKWRLGNYSDYVPSLAAIRSLPDRPTSRRPRRYGHSRLYLLGLLGLGHVSHWPDADSNNYTTPHSARVANADYQLRFGSTNVGTKHLRGPGARHWIGQHCGDRCTCCL